jgi:hypothetical protein
LGIILQVCFKISIRAGLSRKHGRRNQSLTTLGDGSIDEATTTRAAMKRGLRPNNIETQYDGHYLS